MNGVSVEVLIEVFNSTPLKGYGSASKISLSIVEEIIGLSSGRFDTRTQIHPLSQKSYISSEIAMYSLKIL